MNDQSNNNTKPENIKELYKMMVKIIDKIYDDIVPKSMSERKNKNKNKAKMSDAEIITIYLLIQCLEKSIHKGYNFLKNNFSELVNYNEKTFYKIVDSFPLTTSKFGRAFFF